ncbi:UV-endonuclease UvdE [Kipferlia bialata]|uniref:UV-endonuclease UvdE n=1 Tax=Kipferlia bialata TaxID=797122 RepID=A0A9K3GE86_9EUKA|nr:UV-endonuclease UvdE [Kipferlia bialata]|eukprot:g270.t1
MPRFGYCCINLTLGRGKVSSNRSMIKATFDAKGLPYASELALKNLQDLHTIIQWNADHGIEVFRLSSDMFPWMDLYALSDLPDYPEIKRQMADTGKLIKASGQRISMHPGPFTILASLNQGVVERASYHLHQHAEILDLLGCPRSPDSAINIHIGTQQGGREEAMKRFVLAFAALDDSVKHRLTIENDDKFNLYNTEHLYHGIHKPTGIPIVFDYHHHWCNPGDQTEEDALKLAAKTWVDSGARQLCHMSSSKLKYEDETATSHRNHSDYLYSRVDPYGLDIDVEIEAKAKEKAYMRYMEEFEGVDLGPAWTDVTAEIMLEVLDGEQAEARATKRRLKAEASDSTYSQSNTGASTPSGRNGKRGHAATPTRKPKAKPRKRALRTSTVVKEESEDLNLLSGGDSVDLVSSVSESVGEMSPEQSGGSSDAYVGGETVTAPVAKRRPSRRCAEARPDYGRETEGAGIDGLDVVESDE